MIAKAVITTLIFGSMGLVFGLFFMLPEAGIIFAIATMSGFILHALKNKPKE